MSIVLKIKDIKNLLIINMIRNGLSIVKLCTIKLSFLSDELLFNILIAHI